MASQKKPDTTLAGYRLARLYQPEFNYEEMRQAMSSFDDRERAEEARYAHDQETQFKIMARRNKLLGMWAADLMKMQGEEAQAYAKAVVIADLEEAGDDDVFRMVRADFDKYGVKLDDSKLREEMSRLIAVARDQVLKEQE